MIDSVTYYPKTKTALEVIRIVKENNKAVITIYYSLVKNLVSKKVREKFKIKSSDIIEREHEDHKDYFHKPEKPFEFHTHIIIDLDKVQDFLKYLFNSIKFEKYHFDRLFEKNKNKKFSDGSIITTKGYIEDKKIVSKQEYNYVVLSDLVTKEEIKDFFEKRGNWKEFDYGTDPLQYFIFYDSKKWNVQSYYMYRSLFRNSIDSRVINLNKNKLLNYFFEDKDLKKYIKEENVLLNIYELIKKPHIMEKLSAQIFSSEDKIFLLNRSILFNSQDFAKFLKRNKKQAELRTTKEIIGQGPVRKKIIKNYENFYLKNISDFYNDKVLKYKEKQFIIDFHFVYKPKFFDEDEEKIFIHKDFRLKTTKKKYNINNFELFFEDITNIGLQEYFQKKNYNLIIKQIKDIMSKIKINLDGKCYPENKYCFYLFHASFYITNEHKIIFWQLDDNIDYFNEKKTYFDILEGIMSSIIDPILKPHKKIAKYKNFLEI